LPRDLDRSTRHSVCLTPPAATGSRSRSSSTCLRPPHRAEPQRRHRRPRHAWTARACMRSRAR